MLFILYSYDGKLYISRNGGGKNALSGDLQTLMLPMGTMESEAILGISSFADTFYLSDSNSIVRIDGKFEATTIVRSASNARLASDGKTIFYLRGTGIYRINGMKQGAEAVKLVEEDVSTFTITADGKSVYFVNSDDELFFQKGKGKPVRIGGDVSSYPYLAMFKGEKLFYISDDELFWSTGGKGKAVSGVDGSMISVYARADFVCAWANDGGGAMVYTSRDGSKFELLDTY